MYNATEGWHSEGISLRQNSFISLRESLVQGNYYINKTEDWNPREGFASGLIKLRDF